MNRHQQPNTLSRDGRYTLPCRVPDSSGAGVNASRWSWAHRLKERARRPVTLRTVSSAWALAPAFCRSALARSASTTGGGQRSPSAARA
ncbi:hypothetical protein [Streptomyces sp. Agncl-13]|uniref:hypothetical protein n=1 Tax=Streptomyces sp. Agncl-13 TaxID=3400628 RepID=UPI003A882A77